MGRKIMISVGALVALGLVAGAFYWVRARGSQQPLADTVSPEPSEFREASVAAPPPVARSEKAAPATKNDKNKKTAPSVAELSLRTGEVLNYTANVSKLDRKSVV